MSDSIKAKIENKQKLIDGLKADRNRLKLAVMEGIEETNANEIVQESYHQSGLKVRSGILINSFQEDNSADKKQVYSDVAYSRIHDVGGVTGRGYKTVIKPTNYFSNAIPKIWAKILENIKKRMK